MLFNITVQICHILGDRYVPALKDCIDPGLQIVIDAGIDHSHTEAPQLAGIVKLNSFTWFGKSYLLYITM
ncbi:TPA: hypothetical protein R3748_003573 [Salmonella enterica subsp. enterica serovar Weltevreden]|uniref:hypothetical protein n=1 Tax=Citrobacter arsenatis TaxID=2546350 RepID=UPI0014044BAD|nr:hypothetical protein [Citrobacter arsenatis]HEC6701008.1 hypothetical protein [Salmonella enterica subsp. enterica serovar Weltevreden]HEC6914058.1 hypothetical protein [Salmonella enterica subsp. enterica serovar Weltevreden]